VLLYEQELDVANPMTGSEPFSAIAGAVRAAIGASATPLRFAVASSDADHWQCELGVLTGRSPSCGDAIPSIFEFTRRCHDDASSFNVALIVPTGVGAEIGGHAGDGTPVARMLGCLCDFLITHPNVVNASDINEMPENTLYVEGSVLARLLMGTVGLARVRSNRVLVVIDAHKDELFTNAAVNAVSAARSSYGLKCPAVLKLDPPIKLRARYTSGGLAAGRVEELVGLCAALEERRDDWDAVAIASVIDVPHSFHMDYFLSNGQMVNPWGGVEAMLTHAISSLYDVPSAHSPMFETQAIADMDPGIVDPRMAAEAISLTFLPCILKGLMRSPRIIRNSSATAPAGIVTASNVSCVIIPDGCIGLPTLAALHQGIPVIAVRENRTVVRNDLRLLPWRDGQLWIVENYWEAAGVLAALKAGIAPEAVRRPLLSTVVHHAQPRNLPEHPTIRSAYGLTVRDATCESRIQE
jgi:hypothetical protein